MSPAPPHSGSASRAPQRLRLAVMLAPALLVVGVFFVAGVGQAVAQSLGYQPFLSGWHWSIDAYRQVAADPATRASLWLTLRVSLLSTGLAAALGVGAALLIRRSGPANRVRAALTQTNLAVPHLVGALCMMLLLGQAGSVSRLLHAVGVVDAPAHFPALTGDRFGAGIIAEYVWKETPFLALLALAALGRGAAELSNAARVLGAGRCHRWWHVTVPVLAPSVATGSILVFAFTFGSYEVPYLLGRPYPATLPVVAFQSFRDTDLATRPQAMALAVLIAVVSLLAVAGYLALTARLARRSL